MKNKTYKKKSTKFRRQRKMKIAVMLAVIIAVATISIADKSFKIDPVVAETKIEKIKVWPKTTPTREWVLVKIYEAGLNPDEADRIISCESKWNDQAHAVNWNNKQGVDRGLWMINSLFHKEVSNACAYDYKCATEQAIRIYRERKNWSAWSCSKILNIK